MTESTDHDNPEIERLNAELRQVRRKLEDAEQALEAIRSGQVDSLIVNGPQGPRIFSIEGADNSYRVLVETMDEGAATLNEDWTILYCNSRFADMLQTPLERVMGSPVQRFLAEGADQAFALLANEAQSGDSRGETQLVTESGRPVPVLLSLSVVHDGPRPRLCVIANDLSPQTRNEGMDAAELARAVIEQAAEAIIVCDSQGRITHAGAAAQQLCHGSPLRRNFDEVFKIELATPNSPTITRFRLSSVTEASEQGRAIRAVAATLSRTDGSRADILLGASVLRGTGSRVYGWVINLVDVSDYKHAQSALRRSEESLRDSERRKNDFLAVLSHELRNPLSTITNSLYVLEHSAPGSVQALRAQSVMNRQTGQLSRLVDDLLDVTRFSTNKIRLRRRRTDLNELVRHTTEDHLTLFENGGIEIEFISAPGPVYVSVDSNRVAQVVGNLLQNAAKFTDRGGRTRISVSADPHEAAAIIHVSDTGAGIAPEVLDSLFLPFMQAEQTLDRTKGGLGLGLALVQDLVELHGGTISAHSNGIGKGAEFTVRLPLDSDTSRAMAEPTPNTQRRRRILIVEDNVDAAETLRDVLEFSDHDVHVAYSAQEGLAHAREHHPDVVLCDIGLPGMDGYDFAREFRADDTLHDSVLIALTGYAMPEDLQRATRAGFDRHLAKPASFEKIDEMLRSLPPPGEPRTIASSPEVHP